ncbi:YdcF family protein [Candidatus Saccharibacteria bacterium]|nr:YdcF family protein [Candidatus Saccharibacteria bacterium]
MKDLVNSPLGTILSLVSDIRYVILAIVAIPVIFTFISYQLVSKSSSEIYSTDSADLVKIAKDYDIAIVFGGGIGDDGPLQLLEDRLDIAKELLDKKLVNKVILSGDNRTESYNEPDAMFKYLVENGVSTQQLQKDYAGRSTYETCERAQKIFELDKVILISEETHLPRASYLCHHFGLETIGVKSEGIASANLHVSQSFREILARDKAVFNVYFIGEKTVLGDPIKL